MAKRKWELAAPFVLMLVLVRHRSPVNFMVNLLGGLIAYCHQPKKSALKIEKLSLLKTP